MSPYLYLLLNLGSVSVPLLYSILERKFYFIRYFKIAVISIVSVAVPFLIWDGIFTKNGIWGFDPDYFLGVKAFGMPIEEWLFFFCIPYACLFTHEILKYHLPKFKLSKTITLIISSSLIMIMGLLLILNYGKWYTTINFMLFILLVLYGLKYHLGTLQEYFPSFLVILLPFLLVNGILTGSFIDSSVIWYNDNENLGFRIFTIPLEDFFYAFNMLFPIQLIFNTLKKKFYAEA
ncbi:lycopene cyclase domain-containing protein [Maribacter sp. 2304DJ31-5]|uniref:lycopene cyclase domain-containing protein n=1 Tax=Maribacter sp. 2304DJ31-5 TaxID=3386273 RepID=UPI0039BC30FC